MTTITDLGNIIRIDNGSNVLSPYKVDTFPFLQGSKIGISKTNNLEEILMLENADSLDIFDTDARTTFLLLETIFNTLPAITATIDASGLNQEVTQLGVKGLLEEIRDNQTDKSQTAVIWSADGSNALGIDASGRLTISNTFATQATAATIATNTSNINTNLTNGNQLTKLTDGTDQLAINADGSINVNGSFYQATQPISVADGQDVTLGAKADTAATNDTGTFSIVAFIKRILQQIATSLTNWTTLLGRLPAALTGSGNFKTAVSEALPTGTNSIGNINTVSTLTTITNPVNTHIQGGTTDGGTTVSIAAWVVNTANNVIAADSTRRGLSITNNTNKTLLIRLGNTNVSTTIYTVSLAAGGLYEVPLQLAPLKVTALYTAAAPAPSGSITLTISL